MRRRSLFVELFSEASRAEDRKFRQPLDELVLITKRGELLGALWSMVKAWDASGRPGCSQPHNGLGPWSNTIAAIIEHAGLGSPTARAQLSEGGDTEGDQITKLMSSLFEKHGARTLEFEEIVHAATDEGLFEYILGDGTDVDRAAKTRFSRLLKRYDRMVFGEKRLRFYVMGQGHSRRYRVDADPPSPPLVSQ